MRLLAAHQWFVKHRPRPRPADMDMAAAMAASLSVASPTEAAAVDAHTRGACSSSGTAAAALQQQQRPAFQVPGTRQQVFNKYKAAHAGEDEPQAVARSNTSR